MTSTYETDPAYDNNIVFIGGANKMFSVDATTSAEKCEKFVLRVQPYGDGHSAEQASEIINF